MTTRTQMKKAGEHTDGAVKAFKAKWGYDSDQDAWRYLAQYALNRLEVLARNASKSTKPAKKAKPAKKTKKASTAAVTT